MLFRRTTVAAFSALALLVAVPNSAQAANGDFLFKVGPGVASGIADPASGTCIDLPGATEDKPAFAPHNLTTSTATVFLDFGCDGDVYYVMDPGKKLGNRLKLRSVVFS
ncbi:hypothetical protein ACIA8O_35505 [Kitasatospora sp. NPDC051853]|uniref:hypothetical protein n=1 Tax=Kitasatospora sp. NPDC051853 TaxID=3364058 RepID=UPI0037957D4D